MPDCGRDHEMSFDAEDCRCAECDVDACDSSNALIRQLKEDTVKLRASLVRVIRATGGSATAGASTDFLCAAPEEVRLAIIGERERIKDEFE